MSVFMEIGGRRTGRPVSKVEIVSVLIKTSWRVYPDGEEKIVPLGTYFIDSRGGEHYVTPANLKYEKIEGDWEALPKREDVEIVEVSRHKVVIFGDDDDGHWGPHSED